MVAVKGCSRRLENIWEESLELAPETPTESMEFLGRSWSLSALELSKALSTTHSATATATENSPLCLHVKEELIQPLQTEDSPPISPRNSEEVKELLLLNQDYMSLQNGAYKRCIGIGRWVRDDKERKKQEVRRQKAEVHAAVSVAGVAAAVAALAAPAATASAAALVASHCIHIAQQMGAQHDHIMSVVNSAISARTNGDIMTLTAGAATALRGAATLKSTLLKGQGYEETNISTPFNFASKGGHLLKLTRKGDLHWKQVSFNIDSNGQVVAKMKSKHVGGTFTKKKKCVVTSVYYDVPVWPGISGSEDRVFFGIKTADRIIQFQCKTKDDKLIWIQGIRLMLNHRAPIT